MQNIATAMMPDSQAATQVLDVLHQMNIPADGISVITNENINLNEFAEQSTCMGNMNSQSTTTKGMRMNALLSNMSAIGTVSGENLGIVGAGPLITAVSAGRLGATDDHALGGLTALGISQEQVQQVEHAIHEGGVLIGVNTEAHIQSQVCDTFQQAGAQFVTTL